jgi:hypothetical protein
VDAFVETVPLLDEEVKDDEEEDDEEEDDEEEDDEDSILKLYNIIIW